jgi:import inner membrane translocase subunit TIM21
MKVNTAAIALRPILPALRPLPASSRLYATQNSLGAAPAPGPRRRTVTAFNDDGHVPWNELSAGEKASRATQQSFNFGMIIAGVVLTVRLSFGGLILLRTRGLTLGTGRSRVLPMDRCVLPRQPDSAVQPSGRSYQRRPQMYRSSGRRKEDHCTW